MSNELENVKSSMAQHVSEMKLRLRISRDKMRDQQIEINTIENEIQEFEATMRLLDLVV